MTGVLVALQPIDCESRRDTYFLQYIDASDRVFDRAVQIYSTKFRISGIFGSPYPSYIAYIFLL